MARRQFTSESVTQGHPDKVCDQVSDGILDAILQRDPGARVACEVTVSTGMVQIMGEITTDCYVDIPAVTRSVLRDIGYTDSACGFDADSCAIVTAIDKQSRDIAMGVDTGGAGDQGMMFGYACDETPELMPLPISLAHRLSRRLDTVRKDGTLPWLRPDGKSQVTVEYDGDTPVRVDTVVISAQHAPEISAQELREEIMQHVILPVVPADLRDAETTYHINPTGRFVVGGPQGDSGLTGRKIIVDTYGGFSGHGGGAFSGKDPTKVDRSAAYAARWMAKTAVAAGLAGRCEVQLAYAIGVAEPVSVYVDTFGTGLLPDEELAEALVDIFDLTPGGIIRALGLSAPIYRPLAAYGHMGREDLQAPWESRSRVKALQERTAQAAVAR